jgi:long-chain acyl-CoA synthetase
LGKALSRAEALAQLTRPGEPYALETRVRDSYPERIFTSAPRSLRALFEETASDLPFFAYEDERLTFAEAWTAAGRLGHGLVHQYGVAKGDRVAISMRNYPEWIIAFTAITAIGAIAVAMNAHWRPDEIAFALKDSGAKVLFADRERLERLALITEPLDLVVIGVRAGDHPGAANYDQILAAAGEALIPDVAIDPDDLAIMLYTSGSTGNPKGVPSTHRNVLSALLSWELDVAAGVLMSGAPAVTPPEQPGVLLAIPLFHVTGSHAVYLASYRAQRRVVSMYKWDPAKAAELIERERITSLVAPSAVTGDLVRVARETGRSLETLAVIGGGGAPRPAEQVRQIDAVFANAMPATGWGMTETNAIGVGISGPDYLGRPLSSGRCSAVLDLKIIGPEARALPAGGRGELLVRGASVFPGYWNRPDANLQAFTDGWFHTGDVAYIDDEGFVFIVDRIKDIIIRGGENIGCGRVEDALLAYPDVFEAAVFGVPEARLGEEVGAAIYASPDLDEAALRAFLSERLAGFEVPRYIFVREAPLPRTASGKILKRELRKEALAGGAQDPSVGAD